MIVQDGAPYLHLGLVFFLCLLGAVIFWVALKAQSGRMDVFLPVQLLFILYRFEDLNPRAGGCNIAQIQSTAGGLVGALFSRWQIQFALDDLARRKAVNFDEDRKTYWLTPSGRHILEYGFPKQPPPRPPPPDDGEPT